MFYAVNIIGGVSKSTYDSDPDNEVTFISAVRDSLGFSCQITLNANTPTEVSSTSRRLDDASYFLRTSHEKFQTTGDLNFSYSVSFNLQDDNQFYSAEVAYETSISLLNNSVIYGSFQSDLIFGGGAFRWMILYIY